MKNENFVVIQGWMINELGLKGTELMVYAIIYGFSMSGEGQKYTGGLRYLIEWTNTSKMTVMRSLNALIDKGLILKEEGTIRGVKYCNYSASGWSQNDTTGNIPEGGNKMIPGGIKMRPNNIDNIDKDFYIEQDKEKEKDIGKFTKPSIDDISKYITEQGYHVDASAFYDFYESKGWMVGKNKMKDWRAAVRTWERSNKNKDNYKARATSFNNFPQRGNDEYDALEKMLI